ncbi:MAG: hypothetical protein CMJ60_11780 [Planctomycetaceae bacterium]|nr:hypothetical protein [Planctomycetaceae bacterium]
MFRSLAITCITALVAGASLTAKTNAHHGNPHINYSPEVASEFARLNKIQKRAVIALAERECLYLYYKPEIYGYANSAYKRVNGVLIDRPPRFMNNKLDVKSQSDVLYEIGIDPFIMQEFSVRVYMWLAQEIAPNCNY